VSASPGISLYEKCIATLAPDAPEIRKHGVIPDEVSAYISSLHYGTVQKMKISTRRILPYISTAEVGLSFFSRFYRFHRVYSSAVRPRWDRRPAGGRYRLYPSARLGIASTSESKVAFVIVAGYR